MRLKRRVRAALPRRVFWRVRPIRLSWASGDDPNGNFGDQLSPHLLRRLFNVEVVHSGMPTADLISTGSILDWAEEAVIDRQPMVWGSGFIRPGPRYAGARLRPLAVRGRLSMERLLDPNAHEVALGDPGLLTAVAFPELRAGTRAGVGIVPHFTERESPSLRRVAAAADAAIIDVLAPFDRVIRRITSCGAVVSSSLHGLVIADAFGIPNAWMRPGPDVDGGRYKFDDYYSAFGETREPAEGVDLLADVGRWATRWRPLPTLASRQRQLLASFPLRARVEGP